MMKLEDLKALKALLELYLPFEGTLKVKYVLEAVEEDIKRLTEK